MDIYKIADFRNNLKEVTDTVIETNSPIQIIGPKNKNLVLLTLDNYNHLKTKNMNASKVNWYTDYVVNETIREEVTEILGAYSRLKSNNPEHKDYEKWKSEAKEWIRFESKLSEIVLPTKEKADELIAKITTTSKALLELEKNLKENRLSSVKGL